MVSGMSGRDAGQRNVETFKRWIHDRREANDWADYVWKGQLHRPEIAKECDFAPTVVRQNPAVVRLLAELEDELRREGVLTPRDAPETAVAVERPDDRRADAYAKQIATLQTRVDQLEAEVATLRMRNTALEGSLTRHNLWERHLHETGRVLR